MTALRTSTRCVYALFLSCEKCKIFLFRVSMASGGQRRTRCTNIILVTHQLVSVLFLTKI